MNLYTGKRCYRTHINWTDGTAKESVTYNDDESQRTTEMFDEEYAENIITQQRKSHNQWVYNKIINFNLECPKKKWHFNISLWTYKKKRLILSLQTSPFSCGENKKVNWVVGADLAGASTAGQGDEAKAQPGHKALRRPCGVPHSHAHHKLKRPVGPNQHFLLSTVACWCCTEV